MGEMIVSCYEIRQRLANSEEDEDVDFPEWVRNLIVINHILIVANSSLNFAIYCKVQGDCVGFSTGNGKKLSYSQAAGLAWLCLFLCFFPFPVLNPTWPPCTRSASSIPVK